MKDNVQPVSITGIRLMLATFKLELVAHKLEHVRNS